MTHLSHDRHLPRRRQWHPTPVLLLGKSHGRRSLVGCSPWGHKESDTTEWLSFHFSPSCIGEGNGNPLQCSCLENPRDGGAWWASVYRVTQSQTWLKWLSSSSNLFFVSTDLPICLSYKWNLTICGLLWLISFTWHVFKNCMVCQWHIKTPFLNQNLKIQ